MSDSKALAIVPRSMSEVQTLAEVLAKSSLLPDALKGKVPDVVVQILAGQELGLSPMASIRGVHVVQGKPILSADTMVALCLGSGLCEYFSCVEETDTKVTYETKRKGNPNVQRFTWSDDDTKLAGLNTKDNWRLHKRQMRRARCKAVLARDVFPDVLAGCYDADSEEIQGARPVQPRPSAPVQVQVSKPEDIVDAEIVSESTEEPAELASIAGAETLDQLNELAPKLATLDGKWKQIARERWTARQQTLKAGAAA